MRGIGYPLTVNPSTSVSVGSSPTTPIYHSQLDFYRFFKGPLFHQLRKFYALDCSKLAQRPLLSVLNTNQNFNHSHFSYVTSETGVTFSQKASIFSLSFDSTNQTKFRQNISKVRKNCVISQKIYRKNSDFPVKNSEKQGTNNTLLHFIGTYATLHYLNLETYGHHT